jgi:glycosyltransferase involved in cell wall biosynthesis
MRKLDILISHLGLERNVHFIGYHTDSAQFLAQVDMFVLSSISEGFSISTIEAMATGLPVVVTRCGGPEEIITHEVTGLIVEINDPGALACALLTLLNNEPLQHSLADAGAAEVRSRFEASEMLLRYREMYSAVLAKRADFTVDTNPKSLERQ